MQQDEDAGQPEQRSLPVLDSVTDYEKIERIGEGTFGVVCEWPWPRR